MRKRRQGDGVGCVELFLGQIQELENLGRGAQGLDEELIDAAEALDGFVGFEEREGEGAEGTDGHAADFNSPRA